jgi:hypothetical protein
MIFAGLNEGRPQCRRFCFVILIKQNARRPIRRDWALMTTQSKFMHPAMDPPRHQVPDPLLIIENGPGLRLLEALRTN